MTKEEFKQLRLEAGFNTDADFARAMKLTIMTINNWNIGYSKYPKYLRNVLKLFKINNDFNAKEYSNFISGFIPQPKQKIKKSDKIFLENAKFVLKDKTLEELEVENKELKQQIKIIEELILELKAHQ